MLSFCLFMFTHLSTGLGTSPQPAQQPEDGQESSLAAPPAPTDSSLLPSPHQSPEVSPGSQLSDLPSKGPHVEGCGPTTSSAPPSDPQGSTTGGEEEMLAMEEVKEGKSNKKHFHCPTCKVTVNSSSQLEAHCSGIHFITSVYWLISIKTDLICTSIVL